MNIDSPLIGGPYLSIEVGHTGLSKALVRLPAYSPDFNADEWLWRALRRAVTHTHTHDSLPPLLEAADHWARTISPTEILRQIGSPFAETDPIDQQELPVAA